MKLISLFSGIDGFAVAAEELGWEILASCEINQFPRYVLESRWPNAYHHGDIHTLNFETLNAELSERFGPWNTNDIVLSGGFPCQPYSQAGKRLGSEDDRHLWPEYFRLIQEIKPRFVVGENVPGLINWNGGVVFEEVQSDLETEGYEVTSFVLPACSVGAPHKRDRVWIIAANISSKGLEGAARSELQRPVSRLAWLDKYNATNTSNTELQRSELNGSTGEEREIKGEGRQSSGSVCTTWDNFPTQSPIRTRNDGFSSESLRQRIREDSMGYLSEEEIDKIFSAANSKWRKETIKAAGNAVVPQVVLQIFKAIELFAKI